MEIKVEVRKYVIENLMNDVSAVSLSDTTPLITGGLIDSIGMISLVRFIESRFGIVFAAREVDAQRLDTLEAIESLVAKKMAEAPRPH